MRVLSDTKEGSIDDGGCEKEAYRRSKQPTMAKICYVVQLQRKHSYQNPIQLGFPLMGLILELEKMCYGKFALGGIQVLRHHVFGFFRPTHLFDDLQYCKSSKIAIF